MLTADFPTSLAQRCFSNLLLPNTGKIIVAFSGGGDSTALLILAHEYLHARGQADRLTAVTIDHGLRPESAREAETAGEYCARLGVHHIVKRWEGAKPEKGMQEAARDARYRLLAEAADEADSSVVLTGHTLDDQCETIAMRGARGEGRGLSGIAPATLYERRIWFVRPLLAVPRAMLRSLIEQMGSTWIDDPSNVDPKFERVRIRQSGIAKPEKNAVAAHKAAYEARQATAEAAAAIIGDPEIFQFSKGGRSAVLAAESCQGDPVFSLALAAALGSVGNRTHLPAGKTLNKAISFVRDAKNGEQLTIAGCLMWKRAGNVRIEPEARNPRASGFGFDRLLPVTDYALAVALGKQRGEEALPWPPVTRYPS